MENSIFYQRLDLRIDALIRTQSIIMQKFNHMGWLSNFKEEELPLAHRLLYGFIYISESNTDYMLSTVIKNLSCELDNPSSSEEWKDYISNAYFAPVRDDDENFSDSGNLFVGKIKKILHLDESTIIGKHKDIISHALAGKTVILLDDFVGTGDQFNNFLKRLKETSSSEIEFSKAQSRMIYCPLLCSRRGYDSILRELPDLKIRPLHILSERYHINSPSSVFWPTKNPMWISEQVNKLIEISRRLGVPEDRILGYKDLGLCIAFQHHVPDATLPIFTWKADGWIPLVGG